MAKGKSLFKKVMGWLHLWIGIVVGVFIIVISLTGCLYVFERDIRDIKETYRYVPVEGKPILSPSVFRAAAEVYSGERATNVQYGTQGEAVAVTYVKKKGGFTYLYMNPYTGHVIREKVLSDDFFHIVLQGHFYLWLPHEVGKPLVNIIVYLFVFMLVSGIVLWWPKNWKRANKRKSFRISWKARFKRLNYDLHNVPGFYVMLLALIIALTGLAFGMDWYKKAFFATLTCKTLGANKRPLSDTSFAQMRNIEDRVWAEMMKVYSPIEGQLQVGLPQTRTDAIAITYNPERKTFYRRFNRYFDRYTGKEITKDYRKNFGEKVYDANYDIHTGAILGMPGKILALVCALVCASLPVTGFMIWWGRRHNKKRWPPKTTSA